MDDETTTPMPDPTEGEGQGTPDEGATAPEEGTPEVPGDGGDAGGGGADGGTDEGQDPEPPRVPTGDKHATVSNVRAFWQWMRAGNVPGAALSPGTVTTEAMAEGAISATVIEDGSIGVAKLAPEVWERVEEIMDEGFGEILNGEY